MSEQPGPILAADGTPLKQSIRRALRRERLRALALVAPLLLFVLLTFVWPIGVMLFRSVENSIVADTLPLTVAALRSWDATAGVAPEEAVYAAFVRDMAAAVKAKRHTRLGARLNYEQTGMASLFRKTGRAVKRLGADLDGADLDSARVAERGGEPFKQILIRADKRWGEAATWAVIKTHSPRVTDGYFLNAIDMRRSPQGIEAQPESKRILLTLFLRTLAMSLVITAACVLLAYPVAWLMSVSPPRQANLLLMLVLLPFWTSLLVRTSAWKVLLQQQGVINDTLVWLGVVADDARLALINNELGTIIAMTHILLPFMILPMYSVMRAIKPMYVRAARSLGATHWSAFWRVYFPQTTPGIGAGCILVFILAIGYYITPEIVGGTKGVFISNRIAYHISSSLNWGLAAALGALLLVIVLVLYWLYDRMVGVDNVKLG